MTLFINEGATCDTCTRQGLMNYCKPCSKKLGRRLYDPMPGVEFDIVDSWPAGQKFPDRVRRIKKSAV